MKKYAQNQITDNSIIINLEPTMFFLSSSYSPKLPHIFSQPLAPAQVSRELAFSFSVMGKEGFIVKWMNHNNPISKTYQNLKNLLGLGSVSHGVELRGFIDQECTKYEVGFNQQGLRKQKYA